MLTQKVNFFFFRVLAYYFHCILRSIEEQVLYFLSFFTNRELYCRNSILMIILVLASLSLPLRLSVGVMFSVVEELYSSVCVFVPSASNKNVGFLYNFFSLLD
jgi:hypothetical protein